MKLKDWNFPYEKKIIAIDFDGTITTGDNRKWKRNKYTNDIMYPNMKMINKLREIRDDYYFILWTNRYGKALKSAIRFCKGYGIDFDAVNKNIVPFKSSRKIVADYYLDDKNIDVIEFVERGGKSEKIRNVDRSRNIYR